MTTVVNNLASLAHFNDRGEFLFKKNCSIVIENDGMVSEISEGETDCSGDVIDGSSLVGLPPFVDCHSHTLFAGNRTHEFRMKCEGKTYLEIAKGGGGILHTQKFTKQASDDELEKLVLQRLKLFRSQGVMGVEIKSGYGLSHDEEIRHLKILQQIKRKLSGQMRIWVTYLGPHAVAHGVKKDVYLKEIFSKTFPQIAREKLADFVDIFVDEGFFSKSDMNKYCESAQKYHLPIKAHIDEIKNLDGSEVAAKFKIVSVDHCRHTTNSQLKHLEKAGVQVVVLPATSFYIDEGFMPMEFFKKAGVRPAISLDYNPGSQPALSWPFLLHLGMKKMGMNELDVLYATTIAPLLALKEDVGTWSFGVGKKCKLNLFKASGISELAYRYGENLLQQEIFYT